MQIFPRNIKGIPPLMTTLSGWVLINGQNLVNVVKERPQSEVIVVEQIRDDGSWHSFIFS